MASDVLVQRLVNRHMLHLAVQEVCASPSFVNRTASVRDLTPAVLEALGSVWLEGGRQVQAGGFLSKVKALVQKLNSAPKIWDTLKSILQVSKASEVPGAIQRLLTGARNLLSKFVQVLFQHPPFHLYTLPKMAVFNFNTAMNKLLEHLKVKAPKVFRDMASHVGVAVKNGLVSFDAWTKENLPVLRPVALKVLKLVFDNPVSRAMLYAYIWLNAVEFEWDLPSILKGFTGQMSLEELVKSLPGSGVGLLLNGFVSGMFQLFPAAIIARVVWLVGAQLISVRDGQIQVRWEHLSRYTGLPVSELQMVTA